MHSKERDPGGRVLVTGTSRFLEVFSAARMIASDLEWMSPHALSQPPRAGLRLGAVRNAQSHVGGGGGVGHSTVGIGANVQVFQRRRRHLWLGELSDKQFEEPEDTLVGEDM